MIPVDRSITPPAILSTLGVREAEEAAQHYSPDAKRPFAFRAYMHSEVRSALNELFAGKCAYCESLLLGPKDSEIDHYRPVHRALDLDGRSHRGYFWLGAAWSNLYPACAVCNRNKGHRFPVVGERARPGDDVTEERAILLDPCQVDPGPYLVFLTDGRVAAAPPDSSRIPADLRERFGEMDRGQITIDVLGLNRGELVEARKQVADELKEQLAPLFWRSEEGYPPIEAEVRELIEDSLPYAGLRRQLVAEWVEEIMGEWGVDLFAALEREPAAPPADEEEAEPAETDRGGSLSVTYRGEPSGDEAGDKSPDLPFDLPEETLEELAARWAPDRTGGVVSKLRQARISEDVLLSASARLDDHQMRQSAYSVDQAPGLDSAPIHGLMQAAMIASIEIENFRPIEHLETKVGSGRGDHVGWKVLLGENGVGKSSVLQAVALALMGEKHLATLAAQKHVHPTKLLRNGAKGGHITLHLTSTNQPLHLELTSDGVEFARADAGLRAVLLGFGSARWLPREGSLPPDDGDFFRVRNLFNPFVPLGDALGWLRGLPDEDFERVEDNLLRLLDLPDDVRLVKRNGKVRVVYPGDSFERSVSLGQLSDGYQTVLAMACEIMELMGRRWGLDMASAEGVVLVDEIGAHLHPRWKLKVVKSLRDAFPRIQFLVTTHEPLCLRGLYDGELMVVRRREGELVVLDDLASPDDLRVDQLLTSPLFGLRSTLDPELEQQFEEYYSLLARKGSLSPDEQRKLAGLKQQVGSQGVLGDSPREQMVYELVDDMLARSRDADEVEKKALKVSTKKRMAELWNRIELPNRGETS